MSKGHTQRPTNMKSFSDNFDRIFNNKPSDPRFCDAHDMRLVEDPKTKQMVCPHCEQAKGEKA